jgi:hypothetical protein
MAEIEMYSSSAGGGIAIMFETFEAEGRQRSRWCGQSCGANQ